MPKVHIVSQHDQIALAQLARRAANVAEVALKTAECEIGVETLVVEVNRLNAIFIQVLKGFEGEVVRGRQYACGKPISNPKETTNANGGCGEFNCAPCNAFVYGE